jgi:hypothetical protein
MFIDPSLDLGASRPSACDTVIPPIKWRVADQPMPVSATATAEINAMNTLPVPSRERSGGLADVVGGAYRADVETLICQCLRNRFRGSGFGAEGMATIMDEAAAQTPSATRPLPNR